LTHRTPISCVHEDDKVVTITKVVRFGPRSIWCH